MFLYRQKLALTALSLLCTLPIMAQASSIKSPIVTKGEAEIELQSFGTSDKDSSKDGEHNLRFSAGYGVTDHWFTEIESEWSNDPGERFTHEAVAWENTFQILPQGEYLIDWGFYAEYEFGTRAHSADELTFGPIFQSDIGKIRLTANPFISVEVGAHSAAAPEFKYAFRAQYMLNAYFNPSIEFYGKMGEMIADTPAREQQHQLGPVISGGVSLHGLGLPGKIGYEAGMLFGLTESTAARTYKGKLEYEFTF
jgi:hypothetical protein